MSDKEIEEEFFAELRDVMKGGYWTHAIEMLHENPDYLNTKKGQKSKKKAYEGLLQDSRLWIDAKLRKIREFESHKNYAHSEYEIKIVKANLVYLSDQISKLDPNDKEYGKFLHTFKIFMQNSHKIVNGYDDDLKKIIEKDDEHYKKVLKKRREKHPEEYGKPEQSKIRLFLDTRDGDHHDHWVEYLPFLGTTTIRLRVVIRDDIDVLWIRPRFSPELYSKNIEWSSYVGGTDDESYKTGYDVRKGFFATYGGGHVNGFKIMKVSKHREEYVFFFLRHHDKEIDSKIDHQITFEAVESHGTWEEEIAHHLTVVLKYPEDLKGDGVRVVPNLNDPKCPLHAKYDYDFKNNVGRRDRKHKEITFQGNKIANYVPRWHPTQKIKYSDITEALREKLKNLKIRVYPSGEVILYYYFGTDDRRIGHLKGSISDDVFYDPIQMVTADIYRFYDDDIVAVRVWFWWIDQRINEGTKAIKHEMPDFERVDFIINLKDPQRNKNMVPFIATDVHWKEFWVDTREEDKVVDMKFTNIGINLINWKQLIAYFTHHTGIIYNPVPAIIHDLFSWLDDPKDFYCVKCGERMAPPQNVAALHNMMEKFDEGALKEDEYRKRADKIKANQLTDMECPKCDTIIQGEEKLQYLYLFEDFSLLHKHIYEDILEDVLKKQTKGAGGVAMSAKVQNCHVPTPVQGDVSHEWVSSTVIKPLTIAQMKAEEEDEDTKRADYVEHYSVTKLEGLDGLIAARLLDNGIVKLRHLINADKATLQSIDFPGDSKEEKDKYDNNIWKWKDEAELMQIKGIGPEFADLLVNVGLNLKDLREYTDDVMDLHDKIEIHNVETNDVEHLPGIDRLTDWIEQAKSL